MSPPTSSAVLLGVLLSLVVVVVLYGVAVAILAQQRAVKYRELRRLLTASLQVLNQASIPYVLSWGTLLGAVREGRIIPTDDDADILLFGEDALQRAVRAVRDAGIPNATIFPGVDKYILHSTHYTHPHVDFYVADLDRATRTWTQRDVTHPLLRRASALPENAVLTRERRTIHNQRAFVPQNPHAVLRRIYGASYITPQRAKAPHDERNHEWSAPIYLALRKLGLHM
jgi:hypothetical protein